MKKIVLTALLVASTLLNADTFSTQGTHTAESKKSACAIALANAKTEAMEEAGTLVFSNFSSTTSDNQGEVSKSNQHKLITAALGVAKLKSKSEKVDVTPEYQFTCKVVASFEIDQQEMQSTLKEMIKNQEKYEKIAGYFQADGYSEEGQSRYKANAAAMMIAQRNLLELIKGADITSLTKLDSGVVETDKVGKLISGSIQGAEIVKKEYNSKTRSAHIILRIKKAEIVDTINDAY